MVTIAMQCNACRWSTMNTIGCYFYFIEAQTRLENIDNSAVRIHRLIAEGDCFLDHLLVCYR